MDITEEVAAVVDGQEVVVVVAKEWEWADLQLQPQLWMAAAAAVGSRVEEK